MLKTPNIALLPNAAKKLQSGTFPYPSNPSAEILAELEQVEASIAGKLAKARG